MQMDAVSEPRCHTMNHRYAQLCEQNYKKLLYYDIFHAENVSGKAVLWQKYNAMRFPSHLCWEYWCTETGVCVQLTKISCTFPTQG